MKAWYFTDASKTLRYGDGRKAGIGVTHEVEGHPVLCKHGLHGSVNILDALDYAPGTVVWRVELSGKMVKGSDKIAAQKRTYIGGGFDIDGILRKFARKCALDVIDLWDAPGVVIEYLKTGDESIRYAAWYAARYAAWDAARYAARDAAGAAAGAATWDAARYAARAAAWDVAQAAAGAAARDAAWNAARCRQRKRLTSMVTMAMKGGSI